ncbi:MAG: N-acetyltransferase family protein [Vicinamibacterales bacterium]
MHERLRNILNEGASRVTLVAEGNEGIVGMAGATVERVSEKDGIFAHLAILVVAERARRAGVGRQLVEAAETWATTKGAYEMSLTSGLPREGAHRFYEACGYTRNGFRFIWRLSNAG